MLRFFCKKGNVHQQNQDNLFIVVDGDVKFFGVFDGHGPYGHRVSSFCQGRILQKMREHPDLDHTLIMEGERSDLILDALKQIFQEVQKELVDQYEQH